MHDRYSKLSETLIGPTRFTSRDVASRSGVEKGKAWEFWRALGFARVPDGHALFTQRDIDILRSGRGILDTEGADPQVLMQIARVSGQSLARMVAVQILPISGAIEAAVRSGEFSDDEAAEVVVRETESLLTTVEPFLAYAWRRHILAAVAQMVATELGDLPGDNDQVVGFADLVGFTAASQELTRGEIAATVDRFEDLAYQQIPEHGGRVVKMIGDEVMFTTAEPGAAVEIALGLIEASARDEVISGLRIGMASGPTLAWEGDVYGPPVNLAARLTSIAHPDTVLVSEELAGRLAPQERFELRPIRRVHLKGIGRMHPRVVRRAET